MAHGHRLWGRRLRIPVLAGILMVGLGMGGRSPLQLVAARVASLTPLAPQTGAISAPQPPMPVAEFAAAQTQRPTPPPAPKPIIAYTPSDLALMAQVIHGEAGGQPVSAKLGVAAVIVNRVRYPAFPATIRAVIEAPGQFQSFGTALFRRSPRPENERLALEAIEGIDPTGGALYFYNPARTALTSWIRRLPVLARFGAITFAR